MARSTDPSQVPAPSAPEALAPLAEANQRQHETIERQSAELERAASTVAALGDELAAAELSGRRDRRRLAIGLAVASALAIGAVLASAWVR